MRLLTLSLAIVALIAAEVCAADLATVKDFGAVGDGVADDYAALKRAADFVSTTPGATLTFSKGVYRINQHSQEGEPSKDIEWRGRDFKIIGEGAVISIDGGYHRSVIPGTRRSDKYGAIPFELIDCERFSIEGLEIDGGVLRTTRDHGIETVTGHAILTRGCRDYRIENVTVRHTPGDGVYLGGGSTHDENATLINVTCRNNARQGLTIGLLRGGRIEDCEFSGSGRVGAYGGESPRAGIDIEPARDLPIRTGNIDFINCRMLDSLGSQFVCESPGRVEDVSIRRSKIAAAPDSKKLVVVMGFPGAVLADCEVDTGAGAIYPNYTPKHPGAMVDTLISRNRIRTCGAGIVSTGSGELLIEDNELIGYHTTSGTFVPNLSHRGAVFSRNTIYHPREMSSRVAALIQFAALSSQNLFVSNRSKGAEYPRVVYKGTQRVDRDQFFRFTYHGGPRELSEYSFGGP